jgi:stearoyl-CoA desaturase (delta-9 desaturase)
MASYARGLRTVVAQEASKLSDAKVLRDASRWLHRDADKVPAEAQAQLAQARQASPALDKMVRMREELRQIWLNTSQSREQLAADLQAWCKRAEDSGIAALRDFSMKLRSVRVRAA